ncbi:LysR family transcriptional regulator [Burkholderia plantarii]|uniref:LysR family transcriptional regulator n=1 Tax=Burkholderia plantarii TaxID=41899 RepID=UPI0018DD3754|nr:LysR family transcriptional regulator [Burkholderia plantarii]MBI0330051.1 LysR family transcriptional regulator [Burkholderia plantarii]
MTIINVANISRMDLNLLVVFQCVMGERSVTRTAEILNLTQGAVSSSLKRLREHFDDDLFVRGAGGMVPTRRALELAPKVTEALAAIATMLDGNTQFAAETSGRVFNIALSDDIESCVSPLLVNEAQARGLSVGFAFHQSNSSLWKTALADPEMDLALCSEPKAFSSHYSSQILFSSSYSCLYDGARLNLKSPITRDEYLSHPHVRVSYDGRRGFVDDLLDNEGIPRKVSASFTHFSGALAALVYSDAIATLPSFAAHAYARIARLTVSPVPISVPAFRVFMIWKASRNEDAQNAWLRNFIVGTTRELQYEGARVAAAPGARPAPRARSRVGGQVRTRRR